ncbi:MAG: cytochrome b/b6 domain-containing protein [Leptolyngbyaceae cyanobacterium CSU_1_3]|nr:cytochrome b/b6 domain-containing protein [Leptolyngbyaceae cyanobacterium CSU_1_3]
MTRRSPYQPSLLRLLHGIYSILVLLSLVTGFWVYNTFDGRFGRLSLPRINPIIDIHGTIALCFLLFTPLFVAYSIAIGYRRLLQLNSLNRLANVGSPIWWHTLQRLVNTGMIFASLFALGTGKLMQESWLPSGELEHTAYLLHLGAWAVLSLSLGLHLLMSAKVGGLPLLLSMVNLNYRAEDSPKLWLQKIRSRQE